MTYTRAELERLIEDYQQPLSMANADERADFTRARAMLPPQERLILACLCQGDSPRQVAQHLLLSTTTARKRINETLVWTLEKMNGKPNPPRAARPDVQRQINAS